MLEKHLKKIIALAATVALTITAIALHDYSSYEHEEPWYANYDLEHIAIQTNSIIMDRELSEICETIYGGRFLDENGILNIWVVESSEIEEAIEESRENLRRRSRVMSRRNELRSNGHRPGQPRPRPRNMNDEQWEIELEAIEASYSELAAVLREDITSEDDIKKINYLEREGILEIFEPYVIEEAIEQEIIFLPADFSKAYLNSTVEKVWNNLEDIRAHNVNIDVKNNRVVISAEEVNYELKSDIDALLGHLGAVVFEEEALLARTQLSFQNLAVIHGGFQFRNGNSQNWTFGYSVAMGVRFWAGAPYNHYAIGFLTTAHDNPPGTSAWRACTHIGHMSNRWMKNHPLGVDVGMIWATMPNVRTTNRFIDGSTWWPSSDGAVVGIMGDLAVGTMVVKHGAATGTTVGNITQRQFSNNHRYVVASYHSWFGDSGGAVTAVVRTGANEWRTVVTGIVQGGDVVIDQHGTPIGLLASFFTDIHRAQEEIPFIAHADIWFN